MEIKDILYKVDPEGVIHKLYVLNYLEKNANVLYVNIGDRKTNKTVVLHADHVRNDEYDNLFDNYKEAESRSIEIKNRKVNHLSNMDILNTYAKKLTISVDTSLLNNTISLPPEIFDEVVYDIDSFIAAFPPFTSYGNLIQLSYFCIQKDNIGINECKVSKDVYDTLSLYLRSTLYLVKFKRWR